MYNIFKLSLKKSYSIRTKQEIFAIKDPITDNRYQFLEG